MPGIRQFKALLYNTQKVSLAKVVAPPYDVISPEQQKNLYEQHPHNVVRLILNRDKDPYTSAAQQFEEWKRDSVVVADSKPAMYILSQSFTLPDGKQYERTGFIAACWLEELGKGSVYPHEKTHSGPKEDRFRLFQSTGAMFSQIFSLYNDSASVLDNLMANVMKSSPDLEAEFEHVHNRVWKITDSNIIFLFTDFMKTQRVFIADGHHRYETALMYRDEMKRKNPKHTGDEPFNFVPMCFVNVHQPGLVILPTHRLIHSVQNFDATQFLEKLKEHFHLDLCASPEELMADLSKRGEYAFGVVLPEFPYFVLFWLKDAMLLKSLGHPDGVAQLDVTVFHQIVLNNILGISDEAQEKKVNLDYEKDAERVFQLVKTRKAQAGFLLNPTRVEQVQSVAEAGLVMPQKSTYFYPKLLSGLVLYSFLES